MAQPSDVVNPIPGQSQMTLGQMFSPPQRTPAMAQALPQPSFPSPQPNPSPEPSQEDLLNQLGPSQDQTQEDLLNQLGPDPDLANAVEQRQGFGGVGDYARNLKDRALAGLGRSPSEAASILKSKYGAENVKLTGKGQIAVRPPGGKFITLESDKLGFFADLLGDLADFSGAVIEGAAAIPYEAAGAVGGAAIGAPTGLGAVGTTGAGLAAGAFAGGMAGQDLRQRAIVAAGGQLDPGSPIRDDLTSGAINVSVLGAGTIVKGLLQGSINTYRTLKALDPEKRIQSLANVRNDLMAIADNYIPNKVTGEISHATADEADAGIRSATQTLRNRLNNQVAINERGVIEGAADRKFSVQNTLDKMREVLLKHGATQESDGTLKIAGKLNDTEMPYLQTTTKDTGILNPAEPGKNFTRQETRLATATLPGAAVREPVHPLGIVEGQGLMSKLTDDYNRLYQEQKSGGLSAQEMFNSTRFYWDSSGFQKMFGDRATTVMRGIGEAASKDRDQMAAQVLGETDSGKGFTKAFAEYTEKTDALRDFETMVAKQDNAPIVAEAIIKPKKAEDVRKFKELFGSDPLSSDGKSPSAWANVKSYFVNKLINDNVDPSTGILNSKKLLNTMKNYGDDVLGEVFQKGEIGKMREIAVKANKIHVSDLMKPEQYQGFMQNVIAAPMILSMPARVAARVIWDLSKRVPQAADRLLDDGFLRFARELPAEKRSWLADVASEYQSFYDAARRRKMSNGKTILYDPPTSPAVKDWAQATAGSAVRNAAIQSMKEGMKQRSSVPTPMPNPSLEQTTQGALTSPNDLTQ